MDKEKNLEKEIYADFYVCFGNGIPAVSDCGKGIFETGYHVKRYGDKTMHFVNAKGILSAKNGMNLYRGCSHGCIYCDSRSKCYHMEHNFEDIEIKANAIKLKAAIP